MRIEINSGGLGAGIAIAEYQLNMADFLSDSQKVISSFKTVVSKTCDLNGGVDTLQGAVDDLSFRIREEEEKYEAAVAVQKKSNDFLDLAIRVDKQVATLVNKNKEEFYKTNPWLRPVVEEERPWYEKAWNWLCGKGEEIAEGLKKAWVWIKDTAKKAWDGLVEFYNDHKKIIDTILIVVGAVAAIVAVIASGGGALIPLLTALGCSAGTAALISGSVAVIAVVSTAASSTLNVIDIWAEIDNPTFNAWQKGLNITAGVSNLLYSIGGIYNSFKGITPEQTKAAMKNAFRNQGGTPASSGFSAAGTTSDTIMFDDVAMAKNPKNDQYFVKGENYDDFYDYWDTGREGYTRTTVENPQTSYVKASEIEGVHLSGHDVQSPDKFWGQHGYSKEGYIEYIQSGKIANKPVEVHKVVKGNKTFYDFQGDGRHRVITGKKLNVEIPVIITEIFTKP